MAATTHLRIRLLGGFDVERDGTPVPSDAWRRNRARALVKSLALAPGHWLHREQLMDALWPDLQPVAAAANLRKAIHFARLAIGAEAIRVEQDAVRLDTSTSWIDLEAFDAAAAGGRLAEALELYRGDLLPEDRFEPWAQEARDRLSARFHRLLHEHAEERVMAGDVEAAIAALGRILADDPLDENAHAAHMRLLARAGARHLALQEYRQLEDRLRAELGVQPGPELLALHRQLAAGEPVAPLAVSETATPDVDRASPAAAVAAAAAPGTPVPRAAAVAPTPIATATDAAVDSVEERKLVTVVWLEAAPASDDLELGRRELSAWAVRSSAMLRERGAQPDRQADGSIVAIFGAPAVREDDAGRAVRAALDVLGLAGLRVRAGIATGHVLASIDADGALSIAGVAMTDARRLLDLASPGAALVAERTARACAAGYRFSRPRLERDPAVPAARVLLGARREPIEPTLRPSPFVGRQVELSRIEALFADGVAAGRPGLVVVFGAAGAGKSRLVRELLERLTGLDPAPRVVRGRCLPGGRGSEYGALGDILRAACGISLGDRRDVVARKLRDMVESAGLAGDQADREETLHALAVTAGIGLSGSVLNRLSPERLAELLGLAWPRLASAWAARSPTLFVLEDLHWASRELLEMAEHLIKRSSGPLLLLATARPEVRDAVAPLAAGERSSAMSLPPLDQSDSERLFDAVAADVALGSRTGTLVDGRLRDEVLRRAEGNPLYLEQLALHVAGRRPGLPRPAGSSPARMVAGRSSGLASPARGGAEASPETVSQAVPPPGLLEDLPDTLQSLLEARLDSLAPPERRLLQEAAVVGRSFWEAPVARALGQERLGARLAALERAGFIVRRATTSLPGQAEYAFRHALLHDVAYESLPRARRARSHAAAGQWLEELAGERIDERREEVASHYWLAVERRAAELAWDDPATREAVRLKAFEHLLAAGTAARARYALDRARELHDRSLTIARGDTERLSALEALGDDEDEAYRGDAAEAYFGQALEIARSGMRRAHVARLCRKLAWVYAWKPGAFRRPVDPTAVEALVAEGLEGAADDAERARLLLTLGAASRLYRGSEPFGQGRQPDHRPIQERIELVERAIAIGRSEDLPDVIASGSQVVGILFGIAGRYADMVALARRDVAELSPALSRLDQADTVRKLAVHLINVEAAFEEGLEVGRRSRALGGDAGPHQLMHTTWPILAALFWLGRWQELTAVLDEHVAAFREQPSMECQLVREGPAIGACGLVLLGRTEEAARIAGLLGDPFNDLDGAAAWQARYATLSGDAATALAIAGAKAFAGGMHGPQHALALLEAKVALEDWVGVGELLPHARASAAGNALLGPFADRAEAQARLAAGDAEAAGPLLRRALSVFRRQHAPFEEARTLAELCRVLPPVERRLAADRLAEISDMLGLGRELIPGGTRTSAQERSRE